MTAISTRDRFSNPTTADIYPVLDVDHCEYCEGVGHGLEPWWSDPNTVQGTEQLNAIGAHILETYAIRAQCTLCGGMVTALEPWPVSHDLSGDYDHRPVIAQSTLGPARDRIGG